MSFRRVRLLRHHDVRSPEEAAQDLLDKIAMDAFWEFELGLGQAGRTRTAPSLATPYGKPGGWIEKRMSPDQRELLKKLSPEVYRDFRLPPWFAARYGSKHNKWGGVLETTPDSIWKVGIDLR